MIKVQIQNRITCSYIKYKIADTINSNMILKINNIILDKMKVEDLNCRDRYNNTFPLKELHYLQVHIFNNMVSDTFLYEYYIQFRI